MNQSLSIWERRQAVASRLEGHAQQEQDALGELAAAFVDAQLSLDDVDPQGCLRAALAAVVHVAASRPGFNLVLGALGHGVRVQTDADGVVRLSAVAVAAGEPEPPAPEPPAPSAQAAQAAQAVASELASLLWQR
ncbi:hypothetical protein FHR75_003020 [Kineococcus radiotolerans]|uniref:Uncharacterized protein n=1 Tax=Kineococcus radiotolerans TaxID=131568 RepID=A0A7W4TNI7_KINRA|nr:hypothetical protein [Kineococcus radiotolerans]MBB2902189.1 hypothetical protein [Kineococcus radiotolerans]